MAVSDALLLSYYLLMLPDLEREQSVCMNAPLCPCHLADFRWVCQPDQFAF